MRRIKETNLLISAGTNNALKCSSGGAETLSHKITKFWLATYCWEHNLSFATEVVFKDNQRADFVVKDWMIAIEVLGSESTQRFKNKSYPLPTIPIGVMTEPSVLVKMMDDLNALEGSGWDFYIKHNLERLKKRVDPISSIKDLPTVKAL